MTKRDLFRVLIKIFGLYSGILTLFTVIPNNISNLVYQLDTIIILIILSTILIPTGLFLLLIFKTDTIINFLKLDKGFDDEQIQIENLKNESILKLSIIIIGSFLILDYIPGLLFDIVNAFKYKGSAAPIEGTSVDYFGITIGIINIVLGYLLLTNYKSLATFFSKNE
ncbi:hypothetical protein [Flavobacterium aquatile]|uniref:Uncharacterized protein n=1 Tax=Flavobacterium aquatile LMG 4008 = ATCC 11947 TaxID=1453498 RepID=A0A095V1E9_9FLAO|nr:hypothetical protein [Flavobacterium aquatile]KGD68660.1 hypothetical protein LG45_03160 [Flavobacterium aquatile LMG 4008 = ATCC 11947]OXA66397.1 hypothetical protein B0A61_11840 [Flavobacterium aquatile LMG 4008 = ATCC 11947]GEC79531.1 hypothetical protein FAQ01_24010 [Flavobacterium aquatile]